MIKIINQLDFRLSYTSMHVSSILDVHQALKVYNRLHFVNMLHLATMLKTITIIVVHLYIS